MFVRSFACNYKSRIIVFTLAPSFNRSFVRSFLLFPGSAPTLFIPQTCVAPYPYFLLFSGSAPALLNSQSYVTPSSFLLCSRIRILPIPQNYVKPSPSCLLSRGSFAFSFVRNCKLRIFIYFHARSFVRSFVRPFGRTSTYTYKRRIIVFT